MSIARAPRTVQSLQGPVSADYEGHPYAVCSAWSDASAVTSAAERNASKRTRRIIRIFARVTIGGWLWAFWIPATLCVCVCEKTVTELAGWILAGWLAAHISARRPLNCRTAAAAAASCTSCSTWLSLEHTQTKAPPVTMARVNRRREYQVALSTARFQQRRWWRSRQSKARQL